MGCESMVLLMLLIVGNCYSQSAFGSYLGNGNDNGPFVNLGFKPSLIIRKKISDIGDWLMMDTTKTSNNTVDNRNVMDKCRIARFRK